MPVLLRFPAHNAPLAAKNQSRASNDKKSHAKKSNRIPWANLLKRVFDIDITICPKCRGKVRIISAIEDPAVISKILNRLGLPSTPQRLHPASGPPDCEQSDLFSVKTSLIVSFNSQNQSHWSRHSFVKWSNLAANHHKTNPYGRLTIENPSKSR